MSNIWNDISNALTTRRKDREVTRIINRVNNLVSTRVNQIKQVENKDFTLPMSKSAAMPKFIGNNKRLIVFNGIYINSWNLLDMYHGYTTEGYLKFSIDSYIESCLRNGYYFKSKNPSVVAYLQKRHKDFELMSGISTDELLRGSIFSILLFGNTFLAKYRSEDKSTGKPYTRFDGKVMQPISALYVEDARRILINKEDNSARFTYYRTPFFNMGQRRVNAMPFYMGQRALNVANPSNIAYEGSVPRGIYSFMQRLGRSFSSFIDQNNADIPIRDEDMLHIRYHATPGEKWAMPPFFPALLDIETLRQIEENMELLVFQFGHPLLHVMVGDEKRYGSQEEIDDITAKITAMESNGFIVTNNRVQLSAPALEGLSGRMAEYITYFKARVFTGLWLSTIATGEGGQANRATADFLDNVQQNKTIELQSILSSAYENLLIELLLEGGAPLDWIMKPENMPSLHFDTVDVSKQITQETHRLQLFQNGVLSRSELRHDIGEDPMDPKAEPDTFQHIAGRAAATYAIPPASANKSASSKIKSSNQHGSSKGPHKAQNT